MLKATVSRLAFAAVLMNAAPVLADDAALSQTLNGLSQQIQEQQKQITQQQQQIEDLRGQVHNKTAARKANLLQASPEPEPVAQQGGRPSVMAPLQPTSLGTLSLSETVNPNSLGAVSQAAPPQPQSPFATAPIAAYQQPALVAVQQPVQQAEASAPAAPVKAAAVASNQNSGRVGQAPPAPTKPPEVQALANVGGVLTPYGKVVVEPFFQYSRSSVNTFLFQGVEVVSSLLIGSVDANRTARDLVSTGSTFRVGVSDRTELEARVPYVWRQDSLTDTIAGTNNQTTTTTAQGSGLGDIEAAAHYQINDGHEDWPFFVGNLRFKSDTGTSPYKVKYDSNGNARTLATGSGFMAAEPSVTVIYPSDPATLFANLGYIHSFSQNINGNVGNVAVGKVAPGDTYSASLGMGVALNDRLSFTLGYEHDYVRPTSTVVSGVTQNSQSLQVGSALSGIALKVNDRTSVVVNLAAGVTKDAPDAVVGIRVPVTLQAF